MIPAGPTKTSNTHQKPHFSGAYTKKCIRNFQYIFNSAFEKLHRYVYDYHLQSTNPEWGLPTRYTKANRNNKFLRFNEIIYWFYKLIRPLFKGWRDQLKDYKPDDKRFERYDRMLPIEILLYLKKNMSLLYKPKEEQTVTCEIVQVNGRVIFDFYSDCGKFGTTEALDGFKLTTKRLLQILQDRDDYSVDEHD